jgi:hypothetical protein
MKQKYKSLENHLKEIADKYTAAVGFIVQQGVEQSEDATFDMLYEEIPGDFDFPEDKWMLMNMLYERPEIKEAEACGFYFALTLRPEYCERITADPNSIPNDHLFTTRTANLVAAYERAFGVPEKARLTHSPAGYETGFVSADVSSGDIKTRYAKALSIIGMNSAEYQFGESLFDVRGEVESYMRSCLMADNLAVGDSVIFINNESIGGRGDYCYRMGRVKSVNAEDMTCKIAWDLMDLKLPLRYVLGRFDLEAEKHFGYEMIEPLYGADDEMAAHLLWEAQYEEEYQINHDEEASAAPGEDESSGMVMQ